MKHQNGFYSDTNGVLVYVRWSDTYDCFREIPHEYNTTESYLGESIPSNYKYLGSVWQDKAVQDYAKTRPALIAMNNEVSE